LALLPRPLGFSWVACLIAFVDVRLVGMEAVGLVVLRLRFCLSDSVDEVLRRLSVLPTGISMLVGSVAGDGTG
jgi:hypothetical protein